MLDDVSGFIRECLMHAADYRYRPQGGDDPQDQQHLHAMESRWLDLAMNCEFAYRLSRSVCVAPDQIEAAPAVPAQVMLMAA